MAYELEGINPSHSFGEYVVFNVPQTHAPPPTHARGSGAATVGVGCR